MMAPSTSTPPSDTFSENPLIAWLWCEGWSLPTVPELARGLALAMLEAGIPVFRLRLTLRVMHPQLAGLSYTWRRDRPEVEEYWPPLSILQQETYLRSPYALIYDGAGGIRRRLELPDEPLDFPILRELRADGATDYVAMPLVFSDGRIHAATMASDRQGGFSTEQLQTVYDMLPALARLMEVHLLRLTARTILNTYLGRLSGERVLNGLIRRGDGEEIFAVIWFCDLRGSTRLADRLPRRDFLDLLNDYFERMAAAVMAHGGDILKFIGDALLAIFPVAPESASPYRRPICASCTAALAAARDAMAQMAALNADRTSRGEVALHFGIALHLGEVMYGNIGAPDRLDFTVIGPAINEAARLEAMCKTLNRPVLVSATLARAVTEPLVSLGFHALRGVREPHELFTLPECGTLTHAPARTARPGGDKTAKKSPAP